MVSRYFQGFKYRTSKHAVNILHKSAKLYVNVRAKRTDATADKSFSGAPSPPHAPRCASALVQPVRTVPSPLDSPNDAAPRRLTTAMLHQCSLISSTAYEPLPEALSEARTKTYARLSLQAVRRSRIVQLLHSTFNLYHPRLKLMPCRYRQTMPSPNRRRVLTCLQIPTLGTHHPPQKPRALS